MIVTSFLDYVPRPGRPGHELAGELGPVMAQRLAALQAGDPRPPTNPLSPADDTHPGSLGSWSSWSKGEIGVVPLEFGR